MQTHQYIIINTVSELTGNGASTHSWRADDLFARLCKFLYSVWRTRSTQKTSTAPFNSVKHFTHH